MNQTTSHCGKCKDIAHFREANILPVDFICCDCKCHKSVLPPENIESIVQQDLGEFTSQKLPDETLKWDGKSEPLKNITIEQEREIYSLLLGFSVGLLGKDGGEYSANKMLERIKEILL